MNPIARSRGARAVVWAALGVLLLSHLCGIGQPFYWGHDGYMGSHFLGSARGVLRGGWQLPVWRNINSVPLQKADAFIHHPMLVNVEYTAMTAVLGVYAWVGRLWAMLHTLLATGLLFFIVRRLTRDEWRGAAAAAAFAMLPATHAFGSLVERDPITIAYGLLALLMWIRYVQAPPEARKLPALFAILAALLAANADWQADYLLGLICIAAVWIAFHERRWGPFFTGFGIGLAALTGFGLHAAIVIHDGLWNDLMESVRVRSGDPATPLVYVEHTLRWARIGFGWPGLGLTAAFLCSFLIRLPIRRVRPVDWTGVALLITGSGHYILFKQACWIHIFLIAHFSAGIAVCASTFLSDLAGWVPQIRFRVVAVAALAVFAVVVEAPAAWAALYEARTQADSLDQFQYERHAEPFRLADEVNCRIPAGARVAQTADGDRRLEWEFHLAHAADDIDARRMMTPTLASRYAALITEDHSFPIKARGELLANHPAFRLGKWWVVMLDQTGSGTTRLFFAPARLSLWQRYFRAPFQPLLTVVDERGQSASACGSG